MTRPACPDPEVLAAAAEARLHGDERERVLRHLATCLDCYSIYTETLDFLDERPAAAAAAAAAPEPPRAAAHKPSDKVVPFDRSRRLRRAATILVPLAAAAALAVAVLPRLVRGPAEDAPLATLPAPSVGVTPPPSPRTQPVRAADLPPEWPWSHPPRTPGMGGASSEATCHLAGVLVADAEAASAIAPAALVERLRWGKLWLLEAEADAPLVGHFERLHGEALAGRFPGTDALTPQGPICGADAVQAGRGLEWLRLAALARDATAWSHPTVAEGLAAARRSSTDDAQALAALVAGFKTRAASGDWPQLESDVRQLLQGRLP